MSARMDGLAFIAVIPVLLCAMFSACRVEGREVIALESKEISARIDPSTGMLVGLISKSPTPLSAIPQGKGLCVYLKPSGENQEPIRLDRVLDGSVYRNKQAIAFKCGSAHCSAAALVRYEIVDETLRVRAKITSAEGTPEIGLGLGYDPTQWDSHWYCTLYFDRQFKFSAPGETETVRCFQFDQSADDDTYLSTWNDWLQMPLGVVEREDRYMLWGSLDLGKFCVLAPNKEKLLPSFLYRPNKDATGKTFVFDTFIRFLGKDRYDFLNAYRWYAQHVYSTNPLTKGIVTMPKDYPTRHISYGNIGSICTLWSQWGEAGAKDGSWKLLEDCTVAGDLIHQWMGEFQTFDGRIPTSGSWWAPYTTREVSAEELKAWVARLHARGLKVYLYDRQLFGNHRMYDGNPPFKEWMKKDRMGNYMPYPCGNLDNYDRGWHDLSDADALRLGVDKARLTGLFGSDKIGWLYADFDNDEFRKWYIERVKAHIEYFDADGVAWDMAWFDIHRGIHHGILRAQYEIYQWLKAKYPEKRVLCNMGHGNPSSLYADMIFMEGNPWSAQPRAVLCGQAYGVPLNAPLYYPPDIQTNVVEGMKYLAMGLTCFTTWSIPDWKTNLPRFVHDYNWLFEFSAQANTLRLVTDPNMKPRATGVKTSVWHGDDGTMIAAYREDNAPGGDEVRLELDPSLVSSGKWDFTVIQSCGKPRPADGIWCGRDGGKLYITGSIGPGELLLARCRS